MKIIGRTNPFDDKSNIDFYSASFTFDLITKKLYGRKFFRIHLEDKTNKQLLKFYDIV